MLHPYRGMTQLYCVQHRNQNFVVCRSAKRESTRVRGQMVYYKVGRALATVLRYVDKGFADIAYNILQFFFLQPF